MPLIAYQTQIQNTQYIYHSIYILIINYVFCMYIIQVESRKYDLPEKEGTFLWYFNSNFFYKDLFTVQYLIFIPIILILWLHDLCLEVLAVHGDKLCLFWAKAFPIPNLTINSVVGITFNFFSYHVAWAGIRTHHSSKVISLTI